MSLLLQNHLRWNATDLQSHRLLRVLTVTIFSPYCAPLTSIALRCLFVFVKTGWAIEMNIPKRMYPEVAENH